MNNTVIVLTLTTDTKERAARIISLIQAMCSSTKDATAGVSLHSELESYVFVKEALYRDKE